MYNLLVHMQENIPTPPLTHTHMHSYTETRPSTKRLQSIELRAIFQKWVFEGHSFFHPGKVLNESSSSSSQQAYTGTLSSLRCTRRRSSEMCPKEQLAVAGQGEAMLWCGTPPPPWVGGRLQAHDEQERRKEGRKEGSEGEQSWKGRRGKKRKPEKKEACDGWMDGKKRNLTHRMQSK